jgi:hypothetical protein
MHIRRAAAAALLTLALGATGCSGQADDAKPSEPTTAAASRTPTVDAAAARQACVDAVAGIAADANGEVPSEPVPDECASLSQSDYLKAYMDGIEQSNQEGRDALQDLIDEASKSAEANQP